ncbi:PAN/Apple domain [Arabidopsis suecica]|uniref:PAN/Apple domain n=1 Tax=Arabidopsis suecica TaxID=45249 RepID=A0A8T2AEZ1_ARASU|nr:PAN/Apple domain [Arabidopsis suecica]
MKSLVTGELLDSGNFVLRYINNDGVLWQSFDFPTDVLVSGMKFGWDAKSNINRVLKSWRSLSDPSPGEYTYGVERHELAQSFIRKKGVPTFRSDPWKTKNDVEYESGNLTYTTYRITVTKEEATYFFSITNESFFSILRMSYSGVLKRSTWIPKPQQMWKRLDSLLPRDTCGLYNKCGAYGLCDTNTSPNCVCIHGLNCSRDGFEQLRTMKLPDITKSIVDRSIGLEECHGKCIGNCNCTAYANTDMQNGGSGCVIWVEEILDLRKNAIAGQDLFVRLAATDISKNKRKLSSKVIILIVGVGIVLLLGVIFILFCIWKRKKRMPTRVIAPLPIGGLQCAPMELEHIVNATEKFSDCNKIGQGGFGIVYKGILLDGQAIAAKRLLKRSAQGIEGFITEVKLIASVQHINLVKLVGYCFEGGEMILLFEYLENSSLDTYIFDKTQSSKLDWEKRLDITNGIARGLLYLHQDSRYRILHRDLKPSNILLDKDMVPKISDFGMAKLFKRDETEASITKMIGTFGYMAPEYVIDRKYSVKSDVFSFGVLVLEVISGKRNAEFYLNEETLLSYIWRHWKEGKGLEIVDPVIVDSSSTFRPHEVLRCILQRIDRQCRL